MNTFMFLASQAQQGGSMSFLIFMVAIFAIMWFFMIRPQQKKQKEIRKFQNALQEGTKVVTGGGIYGEVKRIDLATNIVEIEIAKESIARRIISREQIIYWISSFKDGDITSEKYRQQLIDTFVHAVFVYDDKIVITYNYSGENNTATISDLDLSSPPNRYWTNTYFFSGGFAVKCSL